MELLLSIAFPSHLKKKKETRFLIVLSIILSIIKDQNVNQCIFSPQGNHQSELIEYRISSIKVTALSKKFIITNHKSLLWGRHATPLCAWCPNPFSYSHEWVAYFAVFIFLCRANCRSWRGWHPIESLSWMTTQLSCSSTGRLMWWNLGLVYTSLLFLSVFVAFNWTRMINFELCISSLSFWFRQRWACSWAVFSSAFYPLV